MIKIRDKDSRVFKVLFNLNEKYDFVVTGSLALHLQGLLKEDRFCGDLDIIVNNKNELKNITKDLVSMGSPYEESTSSYSYVDDIRVDILNIPNEKAFNVVKLALGDIKCAIPTNIIKNKLEFVKNNPKHLDDLKYYEKMMNIKLDIPEVVSNPDIDAGIKKGHHFISRDKLMNSTGMAEYFERQNTNIWKEPLREPKISSFQDAEARNMDNMYIGGSDPFGGNNEKTHGSILNKLIRRRNRRDK